ncbi:MAG: hypothetical protein E7580_00700 [Ruminococcaceae bacterium]|nr:hypothetical protein [Oscillospiraceae bacterium]
MKRLICLLLFLLTPLSLFACGEEEQPLLKKNTEIFSPLFGFTISQGKAGETRLFYMPESDGFLYLLPNENGGVSCGFVSPGRSISSEAIFQSEATLATVTVWENGRDRACVLTDQELYTVLLAENGAHRTPLPEDFALSHPTDLDGVSFINQKDSLLLIHPVDFAETYVLAQTESLTDFAEPILAASDGKKIWYARRSGSGAYKGLGCFNYGESTPASTEDFAFDAFKPVSDNAVLFTRKTENGALYIYRNLETGEIRSMVSSVIFEGVICDPAGKVLCGSVTEGDGAKVHVMDLATGNKKGEHPLEYGTLSPSLAISSDAKTLLIAIGTGDRAIIGTVDLTHFGL